MCIYYHIFARRSNIVLLYFQLCVVIIIFYNLILNYFLEIWEPPDEDIPDDVSITSSTINRLMDITLPSMNELSTPNFSGLLPNSNSSTSVSLTPSTSISRLLKDDGNQWLNPDVCQCF